MQTRLVIAKVTKGLVISLGALTILYSQNTFAQNSNSESTNGGPGGAYASANSGAGRTSSGTICNVVINIYIDKDTNTIRH